VSGSAEWNVTSTNDTAPLMAFNVSRSAIANTKISIGDDRILVLDTGNAAMTVSVTRHAFGRVLSPLSVPKPP
jgi:hypothetical protein